MIVEDDHLLLMVEERLVRKLGYRVAGTATSGESALTKMESTSPDILLVDVNLKGNMSGIELIQQLRKDGVECPVIYLSGESNPVLVEQAKLTGYADYLLKPVTVDELEHSLGKAALFSRISAQTAA